MTTNTARTMPAFAPIERESGPVGWKGFIGADVLLYGFVELVLLLSVLLLVAVVVVDRL